MLKNQINTVFQKFDLSGDGKINLENFKAAVIKEPHLLEIFDYVNQGFQESMNPFEVPPQFKELEANIENLEKNLIEIGGLIEQNPNEISEEGEIKQPEESTSPLLPKRLRIVLNSNINTTKSRSAKELVTFPDPKFADESTPAVKKILHINRTIFLQPLISPCLPAGMLSNKVP